MEPPITRLPLGLLALAFKRLAPEEITLCAMTRPSWSVLIKIIWPTLKTNPKMLSEFAATIDLPELITFVRKGGELSSHEIENILKTSVRNGNPICATLAKKWYTHWYIFRGGNCRVWQIICLNKRLSKLALSDAAKTGQINCLKMARDWCRYHDAKFYDKAIVEAAGEGYINCVNLLQKWKAEV